MPCPQTVPRGPSSPGSRGQSHGLPGCRPGGRPGCCPPAESLPVCSLVCSVGPVPTAHQGAPSVLLSLGLGCRRRRKPSAITAPGAQVDGEPAMESCGSRRAPGGPGLLQRPDTGTGGGGHARGWPLLRAVAPDFGLPAGHPPYAQVKPNSTGQHELFRVCCCPRALNRDPRPRVPAGGVNADLESVSLPLLSPPTAR